MNFTCAQYKYVQIKIPSTDRIKAGTAKRYEAKYIAQPSPGFLILSKFCRKKASLPILGVCESFKRNFPSASDATCGWRHPPV